MRISYWSSDVCSSDLEVDRQHLLPVAEAEVGDAVDDLDAGVGHQHVDAAVVGDGLRHPVDDLLLVGDVHGDGERVAAGIADLLGRDFRGVDLQVGDHHLAAVRGVDLGDALADAAGGAGDQADLVVESVHGEFPCGWTWIVAGAGAGGHCLFVRCCAWRGRLAPFPGAASSTAGNSTGMPSVFKFTAMSPCPPRHAGAWSFMGYTT